MAEISVGLREAEVIRALAEMEAFGQIQGVPRPVLDDILDTLRASLELKPQRPIIPPTP